jgi:hypothetical protein
MITSCELCAKIAIEEAIKAEAERIKKIQLEERTKQLETKIVEVFAEEILAPIISELTEMPNHLLIGYNYTDEWGSSSVQLYKNMSSWIEELTQFNNPMKRRYLENQIKANTKEIMTFEDIIHNHLTPKLNIDMLNQYLENFGFKITRKTEKMCVVIYSTSTPDYYRDIDSFYLTAICPEENF